MIVVQQVKLPISHSMDDLLKKVASLLKIKKEQLAEVKIVKKSIDARKKEALSFVYAVHVTVLEDEVKLVEKLKSLSISIVKEKTFTINITGEQCLESRPVVVGSGPSGLFCAYELAKNGYSPIIIERGKSVEERSKDVSAFWKSGILDETSNVQFGEGGAGTFSDGKLNTLVKDTYGRNKEVLETFVRFGAFEDILVEAKPHIGTDVLAKLIPNMRKQMQSLGATFMFESCMTDFTIKNNKIEEIELNHKEWIKVPFIILAIGHSSRDTFSLLEKKGVYMEAKSFAVGLRVEHPQQLISENQYGEKFYKELMPAPYKLTANLPNQRGVYSFCMCPGGYVVNASSEKNTLAVNGMSYQKRDSANANSAIIVSVTPKDFLKSGPLGGIDFQRTLEKKAYALTNGKIPQQLYGDFRRKINSSSFGSIHTVTAGERAFGELHTLFEPELYQSFIDGMEQFDRRIKGFAKNDVILSGVETRTSSPVRIVRSETLESNIAGLYPCGEGAGYAGGIMSAAMDGIKVAEQIAATYKPVQC